MHPLWIWIGALVFYGAFLFWYGNWSGPLTPAEIDGFVARLEASAEDATPERLATVRRFLEADDGGEFFMANLMRLPADPIADPKTGASRPAADVLRVYTGLLHARAAAPGGSSRLLRTGGGTLRRGVGRRARPGLERRAA